MVAVGFVSPFWKSNLATVMKNRKISTPFDPAVPLLGICPGAVIKKTTKAMCKKTVTAVMFIILKNGKPPKGPTTGKRFSELRVRIAPSD